MFRYTKLVLFFLLFFSQANAQLPQDTSVQVSVANAITDTSLINNDIPPDSIIVDKNAIQQNHPADTIAKIAIPAVEIKKESSKRRYSGKENLFYLIAFFWLSFGVLRILFPKYFNDLYRVFFRRTLKQKQLVAQMLETPLPSLLLNIFFLLVAGLYVSLLLSWFEVRLTDHFWLQYLYCAAGIAAVYLGKYIWLKFSGWIFDAADEANDYAATVFTVNKAIGVFLLPFLVLIIFSPEFIRQIALMFSLSGLGLLFLYRAILTFSTAHNFLKISVFHFALYVFSFEIIPLLLLYKFLLSYMLK